MKWSAEEIKPVRRQDVGGISRTTDKFWHIWKGEVHKKPLVSFSNETMPRDSWVILIANPPDELKPLAYPEHKPSEEGEYIAHAEGADIWIIARYSKMGIPWIADYERYNINSREDIDWFIPYRLDEPEQESEDDVSENWKHKYHADNVEIIVFDDVVRQINHKTNQVWDIKKQPYLSTVRMIMSVEGYDVTKREPELLPCPYCHQVSDTGIPSPSTTFIYAWDDVAYWLYCDVCRMRGPKQFTKDDAIEAWNSLPRKAD